MRWRSISILRAMPRVSRSSGEPDPREPASFIAGLGSGNNDNRPIDAVRLQRSQSLVGLRKRKRRHPGLQVDSRGSLKKILRILTRHIGHAANLALAPKQPVVIEFRNSIEVNRIYRCDTAFSE